MTIATIQPVLSPPSCTCLAAINLDGDNRAGDDAYTLDSIRWYSAPIKAVISG